MIESTLQQKEVLESDAPVKRVIACAGSGKTWVLTRSIVNAIEDGQCRPEEILALTFTNNAAENMRNRVKKLLGESDLELDIYTFNSFGNEIIYQNSFELGLGKGFQLITSSQSWQILYEVFNQVLFSKVNIGKNPGRFIGDLLEFIEDMKNNLISTRGLDDYLAKKDRILSEYASRALKKDEEKKAGIIKELFEVYRKYEEIKSERNMIDYPDQVFLPYMLFSRKKAVREKYRQKYRYILIDEFQDTNVAQARFLTLLYKKGYNRMMIVGDDDQGIYSFRGACFNNILDFDRWECFQDDKIEDHYLSVNFRSGAGIIDPINSIISKNKKRFEKKITSSDLKKESAVMFNIDQTLEEEAISVASYIKDLVTGKKIKPGRIAVLSRRKRFEKIASALKREGIRYELIGSKNFYHEPEILFLISWLKVIDDVRDEVSILYLLKSDKYRIGDRDIFFLKNNVIDKKRMDLIDGIRESGTNSLLSSQARKRLSVFLQSLLLYIKRSGVLDLKELISLIFEDSGLSDELRSGFGRPYKNRIRNVENLIKIASNFKKTKGETGNASFIMYIRDIVKVDYDDPDNLEISGENTVKLMSIHAAKGLEFDAVILPMLWKNDYLGRGNTGSRFAIPSDLRMDNPLWGQKKDFNSAAKFNEELKEFKTEEERRIFYVACSRAKMILLLSHSRFESREDLEGGEKKPKEVVPFFIDLVRGSKSVIPLTEQASEYLKEIDKDYPFGDVLKQSLTGERRETGKKKHSEAARVDWKKVESKLKEAMAMAASLEQNEMNGYLIKKYGLKPVKAINRRASPAPPENMLPVPGITKAATVRNIFSLTPLLDYMECPVMYKWRYVYSVPQKQDENIIMGEKIHRHIEKITLLFREGNNYDREGLLQDIDKNIKPYIETFMKSKLAEISRDDPGILYLERLFYLRARNSLVTGKIDRLDIRGNEAEIIDYKMSAGGQSGIPERYRMQLAAYMAAVSSIMDIPVQGIRGTIFFLGNGKQVSILGDENIIGRDLELLLDVISNIKKADFDPAGNQQCSKYCHYGNLCGK